MNIAAPFSKLSEVSGLIDAGADELYCGYLDRAWINSYSCLEFERKGGVRSNFLDLISLRKAVAQARRRRIPVSLALNGLYVSQQYPLLEKILAKAEAIDFKAFIVADLGLLLTLVRSRTGKQLYLSTGATVFNPEAVSFFKRFGVRRIVLDRQIGLEEAAVIARCHPDIEVEVFILHTLCTYIDGFCTYMHASGCTVSKRSLGRGRRLEVVSTYDARGGSSDACCLDFKVSPSGSRLAGQLRPRFYKHSVDGIECGVCALFDIVRTPVKAVKIVGRQLEPKIRLKSVQLVRSCLDILNREPGISRQEYNGRAQELYRSTFDYPRPCAGNNCYHPSVLGIR